jgi:hypothetical protein
MFLPAIFLLNYLYNYHISGHYASYSLLFRTAFRRPDSISVFRETSSIDWAQLSMFHLETETESILRKDVFLIKGRTMDDVQNCDNFNSMV